MNAVEATIQYDTCGLLDRDAVLQRDRQYWQLRRMQDVILSIFALLLLWPGMAIVALIIVIDSPGAGPVFSQTRIGRDGKPFTFYKFRSMYPNAEQEQEGSDSTNVTLPTLSTEGYNALTIDTYNKIGPKNEVYLSPDQAVAFMLKICYS